MRFAQGIEINDKKILVSPDFVQPGRHPAVFQIEVFYKGYRQVNGLVYPKVFMLKERCNNVCIQ